MAAAVHVDDEGNVGWPGICTQLEKEQRKTRRNVIIIMIMVTIITIISIISSTARPLLPSVRPTD